MSMPIFERKYYIRKLVDDFERRKEMIEKSKNKSR